MFKFYKKLLYLLFLSLNIFCAENASLIFESGVKSLNLDKIDYGIKIGLKTILFTKDSLTTKNRVDLSSLSDQELTNMFKSIKKEQLTLHAFNKIINKLRYIANNILLDFYETPRKDLYLISFTLLLIAILNNQLLLSSAAIITLTYLFFNCLFYYGPFEKPTLSVKTFKQRKMLINNLIDSFESLKLEFYKEYRKRMPVSRKEIEDVAKSCIQEPYKSKDKIQDLILGLSEDKKIEALQNLNLEIDILQYNNYRSNILN